MIPQLRFALCALFACTVLVFAGCRGKSAPSHPLVQEINGEIAIPLKDVSDNRIHFYTFRKGGRQANFFVRTDRNGKICAAFDACFTCYRQKKGYQPEGNDISCRECGMSFRIDEPIWDNSKGCSPIVLKSRIEGDRLILDKDTLLKGMRLF